MPLAGLHQSHRWHTVPVQGHGPLLTGTAPQDAHIPSLHQAWGPALLRCPMPGRPWGSARGRAARASPCWLYALCLFLGPWLSLWDVGCAGGCAGNKDRAQLALSPHPALPTGGHGLHCWHSFTVISPGGDRKARQPLRSPQQPGGCSWGHGFLQPLGHTADRLPRLLRCQSNL